MARGGTNLQFASFAEVQRHLSGVDYPAAKEDLVRAAQDHGAPENVMGLLRQLEERTYESPADVSKAVGTVQS